MNDSRRVQERAGERFSSATNERPKPTLARQTQPRRLPTERDGRWSEKPEERALLSRAKAGDDVAYAVLIRHNIDALYAVMLWFTATEAEAEDATCDAFVRAWRNIGRLRGDRRFFPWLYRLGVREVRQRRERRRDPARPDAVAVGAIARVDHGTPDGERRSHLLERREAVEQAIRSLPEKYMAAVVLRDIAGLTAAEASEALGLREAAFKRRLRHARMTLHASLDRHLSLEPSDGAPGP